MARGKSDRQLVADMRLAMFDLLPPSRTMKGLCWCEPMRRVSEMGHTDACRAARHVVQQANAKLFPEE